MRASLYFVAGALCMAIAMGAIHAQEIKFPTMQTLRNTSDVDRLKLVDTEHACIYISEHSDQHGAAATAIWGYKKADPAEKCDHIVGIPVQ